MRKGYLKMTKEELKNEIEKCEERLQTEQERLAGLREELNNSKYGGKRWKPKKGEAFYYVDLSGAIWGSPFDIPYDVDVYAQGNCFKTRGEAKFEAERRKVIAELSDFAEGDEAIWNGFVNHWLICYSVTRKEVSYDFYFAWKPEGLFFSSEEAAKAAVEAVGEDRVKKYYLRIKE